MEIADGIRIVDLCLWIPEQKTLVFADPHLGWEENAQLEGILLPKTQYEKTLKRLKKTLQKTRPQTIVINGDLKHEFGTIRSSEWNQALGLISLVQQNCGKTVLVKGNHDNLLAPIAREKKLSVVEQHMIGDILVTHGHKIPPAKKLEKAKTIIIGHEHPAVTLRSQTRAETYKCFLKGKWRNKTLLVLPSYNLLSLGSDVLSQKTLSPFLKQIDDYKVYVVQDKIYKFGTIKDLKTL